MNVYSIRAIDAERKFSLLLKEVQTGKVYQITKHGQAIAELRPIPERVGTPKAGFAKGTFVYVAPDFDEPLDDFKNYT